MANGPQFEWIAAIVLVALALSTGAAARNWSPRLRLPKTALLLLPIMVALLLQSIIWSTLPPRAARVHDEFSYLLQADTFLHGRLSNPPHPMWEFFESPHINFQPTYSSMYPPLQGLILAFGTWLTGYPAAGPAIIAALLGSVLAWAMLPWLPAGWAALGGTLAAIRIGAFSYWANSYWGAAHVAIGGAMMLGAIPRLSERVRPSYAFVFALGVVLLVSARPFEGAVFALLCGGVLLARLWRRRDGSLTPSAIVLVTVLAAGASLNMIYYRATTGSPFLLGYQINCARHRLPVLAWEKGGESPTKAPNSQRFYAESARLHSTWTGEPLVVLIRPAAKLVTLWRFFIGPLFAIPLLFTFRRLAAHVAWPLGIGTAFLAITSVNVWSMPHYLAPITAIIVLALTVALKLFAESTATGKVYVAALPAACVAVGLYSVAHAPALSSMRDELQLSWHRFSHGNVLRAEVEARISSLPDKHLILMRYPPEHDATEEWVYNGADIDGSRIVWAHDLGPEKTRELLAYYPDRRVWMVEPQPGRAHVAGYAR